jgi:glycosyltransferase involved in cell wall biosynthesis
MAPTLSIIIPTRERAAYLGHAIRTCLQGTRQDVEILVLDNASTDDTAGVVAGISDPRLRYERNDIRLSMRDNFEKGIDVSRGDILCFIGDDDGLLPNAIHSSLEIFRDLNVDALSAARALYCWPDLLAGRRNTGFLPRGRGISIIIDSRQALHSLLKTCDYYKLPCLYHGFVKRSVVDRIKTQQGRFFLSNQVDMFSSIALSMEGIRYAFCRSPLIINGASKRSNGASHFGGGGGDQERKLWQKEDDLGFLPGFEHSLTVGSLIVESALRYCQARGLSLNALLELKDVETVLAVETALRRVADRPQSEIEAMRATAGIRGDRQRRSSWTFKRARRAGKLINSFLGARPINFGNNGVTNVYESAVYLDALIAKHLTGFLNSPIEQVATAIRMAKH